MKIGAPFQHIKEGLLTLLWRVATFPAGALQMEETEDVRVTRAQVRKREREEAPVAARTRNGKAPRPAAEPSRSAPAARARPTPRAAPARATRRAVPRQKKRVRDAAPARADKSAKPERSSPRGKKGAAASSAQKSPAKPSPRKSAAAAGGTAGASGASGAAASPGDAPPEGSNVALNALLRKLGGGSFEDLFGRSTDSNKFESILKGLQTTGNDSAQLQVLSELCEVLSMGTEESLRHFSSEAFVPVLMNLLNADWNPDVMLYSCRALTHMMEALPNSQRAVVQFGCVDVLCAKLMSIEYIDLAEQALLALGKLAEGHGRSLFRSGGLMAVLSYLDFFPTGVQRAAMSTAAAMCRQAPPDCFAMVKDAVPNLTGLLNHHDQRTLESTCTCFIRLSECYASYPEQIAGLAEHGLIKQLLRLVTGCEGSLLEGGFAIGPPVSQSIFTGLIKLLAAVAGSSPKLRQDLLDAGAANVIAAMLSPEGRATGAASTDASPATATGLTGSPVLVCNSSTQLVEVLAVVNALLPAVAEPTSFEAGLDAKAISHAASPNAAPSKPTAAEIEGAALLGKSLFALLITVCTTTQTTAVAHKSLRALNKIVSVMPKDKLEELPFGNVSRFIGDLLVSNDLVVLSGALSMAEVLMTKMEEQFRESFVREGVVHEMRNLGTKARKDALTRTGSVDTDTQRLFRTASLRLERAALEQAARRRQREEEDDDDDEDDDDSAPPPSPPLDDDQTSVAELHRMRNDPKGLFIEKVQQHAERFRAAHFADDGSGATTKLLLELREISAKLTTIAEKPCKGAALTAGNKAFARVAELMADASKVSVFELSESGLVGAVVKYIRGGGSSSKTSTTANTRKKLELLCKHFDASAQPNSPPALSVFIAKLHACIKSQENLPIHLNEIAGGVTEGLRLLSRPFKLRLVPKDGEGGSLADLSPNVVLIEPLATIHSVHEFLLAKLTEAHEARERGELPDLLDGGAGGAGASGGGLGSLNRRLSSGAGTAPPVPRSRGAGGGRQRFERAAPAARKRAASTASAESGGDDDGSGTTPVWECDVDGLGTWVEYAPEVNSQLATAFASKSQVTFKRSTQTYTIDFSSPSPAQVNVMTSVRRTIRRKPELRNERPTRRRRYRARGGDGSEAEDLLEQALAEQAEIQRALKSSGKSAKSAAAAKASSAPGGADSMAESSDDDDEEEEVPMPGNEEDDGSDSSPDDDAGRAPDEDEDDDEDEEDVFGTDRMETDDADESVDDIALGASPAFGSSRPTKSSRSPAGSRAAKRGSAASSASSASASSASAGSAGESAAAADEEGAPPPLALGGDSVPSKLAFSIRGAVLDHDTTIFHAVQAHGRAQVAAAARGAAAAAAAADGDDDEEEDMFAPATRGMWSEIYELQYCRHDALSAKQADAASKAKAEGEADSGGESGLCDRTLATALGDDIGRKERSLDSIRELLVMLRVSSWLMTPSRRRQLGLGDQTANAAAGTGLEQTEVLDSTLTGKVLRQLQDPLSLCSGVPGWMDALIRACPYVFSFECKHQYFSCTQLGLSRGLSRLQAAEQAAGVTPTAGRHGGAGADPRSVSLRIQRQKVRISRARILESATKVLELYGTNKAMLEVEFFGEVGTGLGPTLEFYTISSRELQRKTLGLWRAGLQESAEDEYAQPSECGLFPAPLPLSARKPTHLSGDGGSLRSGREGKHALPDRFRLLGRLIGKALQDNRLLDIHLSPLLYKLLACPEGSVTQLLTRNELSGVDPALAKTIEKLSSMLEQKEAIESDTSLSAAAKSAAIAAITYDGSSVDSLYLDFTCPGHPEVELCEGGAEKAVTMENLGEYIDAVVDATLGSGVHAQVLALRAGFEDTVPLSAVDYFEPAEMDRLICGENSPWTVEELRDSCKADHGYTLDSPAVQYLFQTLAGMTAAEQRSFLCFATGSPRLPIGGLGALTPPLTVVRRGSDGDGDDPDNFLPTVMTCANYIKLPKYSSADVLKTQLLKAITEGQGSFDLS